MLDDQDFIVATNYVAVAKLVSPGVRILAYCHMQTHFHFVLGADEPAGLRNFLFSFKRPYSMFLRKKYGEAQTFRRQTDYITEINDLTYLRRCIAYVLRNPLKAGIVETVTGYKWSSLSCYFLGDDMPPGCFPITSLSSKRRKRAFKTHVNLKDSGYYINKDWMIVPKSFVDFKTVEAIYLNKSSYYMSYIGYVDDDKLEYDLVKKLSHRYSDNEMREIANNLSINKFGKRCEQLLPEGKLELARSIFRRYRTSTTQLSRVLKISKTLLE